MLKKQVKNKCEVCGYPAKNYSGASTSDTIEVDERLKYVICLQGCRVFITRAIRDFSQFSSRVSYPCVVQVEMGFKHLSKNWLKGQKAWHEGTHHKLPYKNTTLFCLDCQRHKDCVIKRAKELKSL